MPEQYVWSQMTPRQRDALVAETRGWTKVPSNRRAVTDDVDYDWLWIPPQFNGDSAYNRPLPHFTTDITATFTLVDEFVPDACGFVLHYRQDRKRWEATFDGMAYSAYAQTPQEAIAIAYLKEKGVNIE